MCAAAMQGEVTRAKWLLEEGEEEKEEKEEEGKIVTSEQTEGSG